MRIAISYKNLLFFPFILHPTEIAFSVDFRKGVSVTSNTHHFQ